MEEIIKQLLRGIYAVYTSQYTKQRTNKETFKRSCKQYFLLVLLEMKVFNGY